ncbi:hypothetical protein H7J06_27795 [Mycobacterium hodleri]|uniref:hypothetical protein n=1 Tax=Mycolicibacterium hodleri TaxID=49897 RepID=UPI0027E25F43|nr:hypothetical protein [Mycolicibacterium hodleri]MCV7136774.1 hypothetical protein [Mycolicibacterium hodleri]
MPGTPVGAGGALTGGLNELPPVGLMLFSVGVADGAVVVVSVVLDGLGFSLRGQRPHGDERRDAEAGRHAASGATRHEAVLSGF